ncbi:hypothetical protein F5877DRAFT_86360 [Lentinula edodes]|nr:hypothetical protein F5877DRAFT_86360 [Lentinula edodes]
MTGFAYDGTPLASLHLTRDLLTPASFTRSPFFVIIAIIGVPTNRISRRVRSEEINKASSEKQTSCWEKSPFDFLLSPPRPTASSSCCCAHSRASCAATLAAFSSASFLAASATFLSLTFLTRSCALLMMSSSSSSSRPSSLWTVGLAGGGGAGHCHASTVSHSSLLCFHALATTRTAPVSAIRSHTSALPIHLRTSPRQYHLQYHLPSLDMRSS